MTYQRVKKLLDADIGLYSSHLPLDAHGEVGNNIGLAQAWKNIFALPDADIQPFGTYKGQTIGRSLRSSTAIPVAGILSPYCEKMQLVKEFYNFGNKETISSVAIVSGGGGDALLEVKEQ
jgi:putative NIF3 family GTP cyclohydrolase 1 type 2